MRVRVRRTQRRAGSDGMKSEITSKQALCLLILFVISSTPTLTGYTSACRNLWISYIVAFAAAMPLYLIFARLSTIFPGKSLYEIAGCIFGRIAGKIISVIYIVFCISISAVTVRSVSEFAGVVSLDKTPQAVILVFCAAVCFYIAARGIGPIAKFAALFLPVLLVFVYLFNILSLNIYEYGNIAPVKADNISEIADCAVVCFAFPAAESVIFLSASSYVKSEKKNVRKIYLWALLISFITVISVVLNNIFVLGVPTMTKLYYPTYAAVSLIDIGVIRQLEIVSSALFFTAGIVKGSLSLYLAYMGYKNVAGIQREKRPKTYLPIIFVGAVLVFLVAYFLYPGIADFFGFLNIYSRCVLVPELFPVVMWITAEIKYRKKKNKTVSESDTM